MRANDYQDKDPENPKPLYQPVGSSRAETAVFTTLGLVSVVAVVIAVVTASTPAPFKGSSLAKGGTSPSVKYIRSGGVAADVRTWTEMLRYLLASEPHKATNLFDPGFTQKNLTMPTNSAGPEPSA